MQLFLGRQSSLRRPRSIATGPRRSAGLPSPPWREVARNGTMETERKQERTVQGRLANAETAKLRWHMAVSGDHRRFLGQQRILHLPATWSRARARARGRTRGGSSKVGSSQRRRARRLASSSREHASAQSSSNLASWNRSSGKVWLSLVRVERRRVADSGPTWWKQNDDYFVLT